MPAYGAVSVLLFMMQIAAQMSQSEKASETTGRVEYLFIIRSANLQQMLSKTVGSRWEHTNHISTHCFFGFWQT